MTHEHPLVADWTVHLVARGVSPRTQEVYGRCIRTVLGDLDPVAVQTRDLEARLAELRERGAAPAYVHQHYRVAKTFFRWLVAEDEISRSPVDRLAPPIVPPKRTPVLSVDQVESIVRACKGRDLIARRDRAIILLFADTGCRREELAAMQREDIDPSARAAVVLGKGRKPRAVYYSSRTAEAVTRYLRARRDVLPDLWVGRTGALLAPTLHRIVRKRGEQAGIPGCFPHMLRHHWASEWLDRGGSEGDLMRLAGWSTREMLDRYGAAVADRRAAQAYRRIMG